MVVSANFAIVDFEEQLGDHEGDIDAPAFQWSGDHSSIKHFQIHGTPVGVGYYLIQAGDVDSYNHHVIFNGHHASGEINIAVTDSRKATTWMGRIDSGLLHQGENTVEVRRAHGGDNFLLGGIVVHWREEAINLRELLLLIAKRQAEEANGQSDQTERNQLEQQILESLERAADAYAQLLAAASIPS